MNANDQCPECGRRVYLRQLDATVACTCGWDERLPPREIGDGVRDAPETATVTARASVP